MQKFPHQIHSHKNVVNVPTLNWICIIQFFSQNIVMHKWHW